MADQVRTESEQRFRNFMPVLALLLVVPAVIIDPGSSAETVVAFAAVLPFAAWAWWRLPPLALVVLVSAAELYALGSGGLEPMLFLVSISAVIVGGWERSRGVAGVALSIAIATPILVEVLHRDELLVPVWVMGIIMPYHLGRAFREQVVLTTQLADARRELAESAILDERRRIARDVHDLVGHGLAAVLLQVTGARHILFRDPAAADEALADAEDIGRRSLQELRGSLSLMRSGDEPGAAPPLPSATDIGAVVNRARDGGLLTSFRAEGDLARIDPAVGLSLHRVVEEALANARRHAPEAATDVVLTVGKTDVSVVVETSGPSHGSTPDDAARPRFGLVGMRERMAAVGGQLDAGPTPTGWRVEGRAPLCLQDAQP